MAELYVYWRMPEFNPEDQAQHERGEIHTGVLTDEHESATAEEPVLVEERSDRVYDPAGLPPGSVLYVEDHPGPLPLLAEMARRSGFRVELAEHDPGMADRPRAPRTNDDPEEAGDRRQAWFPGSPENEAL